MSDTNFLDQDAGKGFENLSGDAFAAPFVKLLQSNSREVTSELPNAKAGVFFDTSSNQALGNVLKVIPLDFEILWLEWEENMGGLKGKYLPGSIPTSGDRFSRKNPQTGRELVDSWCYYVLIEGREKDGIHILSLPLSSIKFLKLWNNMIQKTRLDSGKLAPFYSSVWQIGPTVKETNEKGQVWYNIGGATGPSIKREKFITPEQYKEYVIPSREMARGVMLSFQTTTLVAAPEPAQLPMSPEAF